MISIKSLIASLFCGTVFMLGIPAFRHLPSEEPRTPQADTLYEKLPDDRKRLPQYATAGLEAGPGLRVSLFASEPSLVNPTAIAVDHKGRVYACEARNYRPAITGKSTDPAGDRIVILEDTDGDGAADKTKVFYQNADLNAPIGIWVMDRRVIVSQSPFVWLLTDENGDDVADKKEVIFSGIEGEQHDHGVHSFVFGPDGKFYFAVGNEGKQLLDRNGQPLRDKKGALIDFKKYRQGLLLRCDEDFSNLEVLGHNFRNNYEPAIDSYGTLWQSDNDDDGNRGVRINYVMEGGNYGYTDELTGAGWRANRTNIEDSIPFRHWHLNDPGVVPNLLQTGAGSPTGLIVYEGTLLPEAYRNQLIHCDAGPNVVRAYPVSKAGAGYTAGILNLLKGTKDQWFRPSDLCTAPDGSLFVSDWYDPGVGGHQMGDDTRGRVFRITTPEAGTYNVPAFDFRNVRGAITAFSNPNLSVRYQAWNTFRKYPEEAGRALKELLYNPKLDTRLRARALWALSKLATFSEADLATLRADPAPDLRITLIRALRQSMGDITPILHLMAGDPDAQVRREVALALRGYQTPAAAAVWAEVANRYEGNDRWYLEALGIGAEGNWDACFKAWSANKNPDMLSSSDADIVWRARTGAAVPMLARLASDSSRPLKARLRYFRAFDFNPGGPEKSRALLEILKAPGPEQQATRSLVLRHLDPAFVKTNTTARLAVQQLMDETYGTQEYMELVARFEPVSENQRLLALAVQKPYDALGRSAAHQLLKQGGLSLVGQTLKGKDLGKSRAVAAAVSRVGSPATLKLLSTTGLDAAKPLALRREAVRALAGSMQGEDVLLDLLRKQKLTGELKAVAIQSMGNAWRKAVRDEANRYIDAGGSAAPSKHPPVSELVKRAGNSEKGKVVFEQYCAVCHQVNGKGADFGPALSEIGDKLPKEAQYLAIYFPSAGISFGYEGYEVRLRDGSAVAGIIASKTETDLVLKLPGGSVQEYKTAAIKSITPLDVSMMPSGLQDAMTTAELEDLVAYLSGLKKK